MTGSVALHGGGEFEPGDESFLRALLADAVGVAGRDPIRIAVVPTAAARGRPALAAAHGVTAFERVAAAAGRTVAADAVLVVDRASVDDPKLVALLAAAHLIHLPGGDPDLIPGLFPGSAAWTAIQHALAGGAVLAGASAGAMALAAWIWTPQGFIRGLGLAPALLVAPHADARSWDRAVKRFGHQRPAGVGVLGLAERTGVIGRPGASWRVVGEGEVRWLAAGAADPVVARPGDNLRLDP